MEVYDESYGAEPNKIFIVGGKAKRRPTLPVPLTADRQNCLNHCPHWQTGIAINQITKEWPKSRAVSFNSIR